VCRKKGCRKDRFPLGYDTGESHGNGKQIAPPPLCPVTQFCPDEGSECVPKIAVGQPCQFDRDGS
jgi:guanyl-specific ribonuclease Sa